MGAPPGVAQDCSFANISFKRLEIAANHERGAKFTKTGNMKTSDLIIPPTDESIMA